MKKTLATVVLALAAVAAGQEAAPQAQTQPAAPQQAQKKEIKDPAEYNAYVGAIQQQDANAKISGLEAFLQQYPNSVVKEDALEALMGAYQQAGNAAKVGDAAQRLLQASPNNLRALALMAYTKRAAAEAGQNAQQNLNEGAQFADRGLQALQTAPKAEGMSDADFQKLKNQMSVIFNGTSGIAALQNKDYKHAQEHLRASVDGEPNNLRDVYPLALAYLTAAPPDSVNGLWFIARAANLAAGSPAQAQIEGYAKKQYVKYHGSDQGWAEVMAQSKGTPTPPAGFTITKYVPPTPAEQVAEILKAKAVKEMSFAEWELALSEGKPEDAEKVWSALKSVPLQMVAKVLKSSATQLELAASVDDIDAKRADILLTMTASIPLKLIPKEGADLQFEGVPVSYEPKPFVMTMNKGVLLTAAPPRAPRRPPVRRKPAK
jgi:hypothetical protein